jgi:hypothetical protein
MTLTKNSKIIIVSSGIIGAVLAILVFYPKGSFSGQKLFRFNNYAFG